jgi:hypothetical protein
VRKWLGDEDSKELLLSPVNAYQRAIQYQELKKDQFGAVDPPGFYPEVGVLIMLKGRVKKTVDLYKII